MRPTTPMKAHGAAFASILSIWLSLLVPRLSVASGEITAWGQDAYGQLDVPLPNVEYVMVSTKGHTSAALRGATGSVVVWGMCWWGQCEVPMPNCDFVSVASGATHVLGLKADGSIVAWGDNDLGQCDVPEPNAGFVAIDAGVGFSIGLRGDGSVCVWGTEQYGVLGVPETSASFIAVHAGESHCFGVQADGSLVAWGRNDYGQCDVPEPNEGFVDVRGSSLHSVGLKRDGSLVAWGYNGSGQCDLPLPNEGFISVAAGSHHTQAVRSNGTVIAWGSNSAGQCSVPAVPGHPVLTAAGATHGLVLVNADLGACCRANGSCELTIEGSCASPSTWFGPGSACVNSPCAEIAAVPAEVPSARLSVHPNPTTGEVRITWSAGEGVATATARVFDVAGRQVRQLDARSSGVDSWVAQWDGTNVHGETVPAGVYFVGVSAGASPAARVPLIRLR